LFLNSAAKPNSILTKEFSFSLLHAKTFFYHRHSLWILLSINIAETARQCGFDDAFYFSRIFKKYMGCSPKAYGEQCAKDD
jgi:AraC-like DNA-binding protein